MTLKTLLEHLKEIEAACSACNRCGMCQSVCPLFQVTRHEGDVARGKLALLDGLSREILTRPERVLERLNRCLLCGACERICSRKVPLTDLLIRARVIITAYTGLSPLKKMVFRLVLTHPRLFGLLVRALSRSQGLLSKRAADAGAVRVVRFSNGRRLPTIPAVSFREQGRLLSPSGGEPRVVFFSGCLIDKVYPQVGLACMKVLSAAGASVCLIDDEVCCGLPALAAGDAAGFQALVLQNRDALGRLTFDALVTACATCTFAVRDLWPTLAPVSDPSFHAPITDITEFILTRGRPLVFAENRSGSTIPVTWHDPCHLKGKGDVPTLVRGLLLRLPGYTYVESAGAGLCCGSGGSFNLDHYDLSLSIGKAKVRGIMASGASQVVTACPGCMLQLTDLLAREGSDIRVRHIMELVAESLA
ncbi:(Fe-S)-binding protein [Desulfatiferula olefinivorans]